MATKVKLIADNAITTTQIDTSSLDSHFSGGTGVTYSSGEISIGQDVSTSATPTFGNITTTGYLAGPATFVIDPAAVGDNTGTLRVAGNLQVDGTTTTINSTTLTVDDVNIVLASGAPDAISTNGAGLTVDYVNATLTYNSTDDKWETNKPFTASSGGSDIPQLRAEYGSGNYLDLKHNLINAVASGGNDSIFIQTGGTTGLTLDVNQNITLSGGKLEIDSRSSTLSTSSEVDMFVYDTSNDADGGAWRKRTSHTSWYNEASSSTRGSRSDFPSVALIVATAGTITIYDGDDPSHPLWMKLTAGTDGTSLNSHGALSVDTLGTAFFHTGNIEAISMLHGQLVFCTANYHAFIVDFIADTIQVNTNYGTFAGHAQYSLPISGRDTSGTYNKTQQGVIISAACYNIDQQANAQGQRMSNADLIIPDIAVSQGSGISVIDSYGNVYATETSSTTRAVIFNHKGGLSATCQSAGVYTEFVPEEFDTDFFGMDLPSTGTHLNGSGAWNNYLYSNQSVPHLPAGSGSLGRILASGGDTTLIGCSDGFGLIRNSTILVKDNNTHINIQACHIGNDYNTLWFKGEARQILPLDNSSSSLSNGTTITDKGKNSSNFTVTGSLTKSLVASGSDIYAYDGFSTSNYITSDGSQINFNSGVGYMFMAWFYVDVNGFSGSTYKTIATHGSSDSTENLRVAVQSNNFYFDYGNGSQYVSAAGKVEEGQWHHIACRVIGGQAGVIYFNGKQLDTNAGGTAASNPITYDAAWDFYIGRDGTNTMPFTDGKICGVRAMEWNEINTYHEKEFIDHVYTTERALFKPNSKGFIGGNSDDILCTDYDPGTQLFHVVTSSGRSAFRDVSRIEYDNTITSLVSAKNGIVIGT